MNVLGIESSCDETAASVVTDGCRIHSSVVASQVEIHARYGGVVPEVASRQHLLAIIPAIERAMSEAGAGWQDLDGVAVTNGPGLAGSLLVGVSAAKAIASGRNLPLTGVNHLEGHIYANWLTHRNIEFPLICLIVSGGHSDLVLMRGHGDYAMIGRTRDDAAGEAFDKAARILGLGYPGGPAIMKAAREGRASAVSLPRALLKDSSDFSFSGIKTALFRLAEAGAIAISSEKDELPTAADTAAAFQERVVEALVTKTLAAAGELGVKQVLMAGGVASNELLRRRMAEKSTLPVLIPEPSLCTDNAAMIAACGYYHFKLGQVSGPDLDVVPGLRLV